MRVIWFFPLWIWLAWWGARLLAVLLFVATILSVFTGDFPPRWIWAIAGWGCYILAGWLCAYWRMMLAVEQRILAAVRWVNERR